jgi:hypothetical protein
MQDSIGLPVLPRTKAPQAAEAAEGIQHRGRLLADLTKAELGIRFNDQINMRADVNYITWSL